MTDDGWRRVAATISLGGRTSKVDASLTKRSRLPIVEGMNRVYLGATVNLGISHMSVVKRVDLMAALAAFAFLGAIVVGVF
ncbi:hypothetical protein [Methylopila sp. Yamaguchi]|uniref:hypothetical protein n=1 Tax=Methylopila sp. Yamaguchi TaxID=1437817 RepID=UPI0011AF67EA|nr:hypothetical protein [Methylopila sp. Yamaguchi]